MELRIGTKGCASKVVTAEDTAIAHGSGTLEVLATPALAALMEKASWESIADQLDEGFTTVGTELQMHHLAPTPLGASIRCESELVEQDRRSLTFRVQATDEAGMVAHAVHKRFIVEAAPFLEKANGRRL